MYVSDLRAIENKVQGSVESMHSGLHQRCSFTSVEIYFLFFIMKIKPWWWWWWPNLLWWIMSWRAASLENFLTNSSASFRWDSLSCASVLHSSRLRSPTSSHGHKYTKTYHTIPYHAYIHSTYATFKHAKTETWYPPNSATQSKSNRMSSATELNWTLKSWMSCCLKRSPWKKA